jgi:methionyl aminopeptidase
MINLYSQQEIKKIALAGKILAKVLKILKKEARIGTSLRDLDKLAYRLINKHKAKPAFLGYRPDGALKPFGGSICASINDVVVHGLPSDYKLQSGDVLKIDLGIEYRGYFADAAITIGIGKISKEAKRLIEATESALKKAVKAAKAGRTLADISLAIEKTARERGFEVIEGLTGHGIGKELHEEPTIYNYYRQSDVKIKLEPGMVLAIEPMFALKTGRIKQLTDESWATTDGSLSSHFEHTFAITNDGPKILTK